MTETTALCSSPTLYGLLVGMGCIGYLAFIALVSIWAKDMRRFNRERDRFYSDHPVGKGD